MADKIFNDVKINLTLKPQAERANISSSKEDLAVQMGKIQQWYPGLNNYATCATAAGTAIKTVDCPGFELTTGTVVIVKFTVTNTAAVADLQLNVNETGAKHIKYRNSNLSAASVLTANRIYAMLYDGTYWQIIGDLDTNSNTYDRTSVQTRIYAGAKGVFPYSLCALDTAQRMQAFTTTGGTGTSKAFNSSEKFLYPPVIMYHSANSTIANGSVIANNVLYEQYPSINMQYNANVTTSSAYSQYKPLYIECTFDSNGYWSPTGITQTFTSGKYYILLGCMYNTSIYQLALFAYHPLYYYDGTNLINGELHLQDGRYLPMAGGTMDNAAEITIPNGSHSSQYTGFGMYHYIGAGNGWARGINVNSATDGTRIGSLGMYGSANATEPSYAYFGKAYNDAWYELYKSIFRINDDEENGFQFRYKPSSLSSGYGASFITLFPGATYGYGIVIGHTHGGLTVVGGGESASSFTDTAFDSTTSPYGSTVFQFDSEELVLTSDDSIWFLSGANGLSTSAHTDWTNVKTALFDSSGNFRPSVDNKGSIGTSAYKWASIYGTTIYENGTSLASKYAAIDHTHDSLYVPNTNAGVNAAINLLPVGNDDPVDDDYYIAQYANGGTTHTTYYRRPASKLYNYIYEKLQHDNGMNIAHTFDAWNTVGWHRVLSLPCSATASGKLIRTLELTAARTYNNAQPEIFSVRLIGLYNTTEGFEILYSKSNTEATQLMTKVRMTKSSDGKTLYVDIYYNSTTSNTLTVFCTLIDPYNSNIASGSSIITWGDGAVVDNSLTVVASLDIPRDITAPGTGFYYVIGTQSASTASWTGTIPASKLHNGLTIAYYLPYASANSTNVTLNLTLSTGETTGAINVYYTGTSRMTTHYGAGSTIILTYFEAGAISVGGTATTDARWTHSDYNSNTNTYVTQTNSAAVNYRALIMGYNDSSTPSELTAAVTNQVYVSAKLYAQPSTGSLYMDGNCTIGKSSTSSYPTGGIHVHDVRDLTVTPDSAADRSANFYFHQYTCDGTNNYWWSILNVRGWANNYASWELAGPASNADQRTTPLYVRTSYTNSAWGNWRKIYDTANPPTYSEVGAASSSHTHSSLNVGNVGSSIAPVYFSAGSPVQVAVPSPGAWFSAVPRVNSSGVMEIGRYIDFHATKDESANDYDIRITASSINTLELTSKSAADGGSTYFKIVGAMPMLRFQQTTSGKAYDSSSCGIWCRPADTNGVNMFMQSGGCIMIGAGEFASSAYSRKDSTGTTQVGYDNIDNSTAERLYLGADGEVQIISNGQNIATYSNNDHHVWTFKTDGNLTTPGSITLPDTTGSIIKPQISSGGDSTAFIQDTRSNSNYVRTIQWTKNGAEFGTYGASIGFHNNGGLQDDPGAIVLVPYATDAYPWNGDVGLYIGKNMLTLDGVDVALQNAASLNTMINALSTGSNAPVDGDYYVSQYAGGGTTTTTYHRRPVSALWKYIKGKHIKDAIAVQTGSSKKTKITLQTLMTWLITTKGYIPSNTTDFVMIKTTWAYANNDILRFSANGVDYEMSLAGVIMEFKGKASSYNSGEFTLTITSAPAVLSDAPTSGYTRFPANTTAVYHCNGSSYNPTWTVNMNKAVQTLLYSSTSSAGYGYADIVIGSVFSIWSVLLLEFTEASYGYSNENPHSGSGLIPLSLVRSLGAVSDISQQYQIPIGYNPGNTTANQYISVVYTDESTFRLSRGGSGGPLGKVKIYGIC